MGEVKVAVAFKHAVIHMAVPPNTTIAQLSQLLKQRKFPDIDLSTAKLIHKGRTLPATLEVAAVAGARLQLLASREADVSAVRKAKDLPGVAGFDHELERERRRQAPAAPPSPPGSRAYSFGRLEAWQRKGLSPPPSEAMKLLQRLAVDAGILGVMAQHRWRVGLLSEMPPEGKVGVSPVCILGVNIKKGAEISLRLRTDDLKGFRRYDRIRETLIHELAHMVHGEHNNAFKEFNSQLRREAEALDWRGSAAARSIGAAAVAVAPTLGGADVAVAADAMAATATSSGKTLRQLTGEEVSSGDGAVGAKAAAAAAALRRAGVQSDGEAAAPPQAVEVPFMPQKGDGVEYRQRDGTWVAATIAAVDQGVIPPSYGIELGGPDGNVYRETEGSRLRAVPKTDAIQGLGHFDAATEGKEKAMKQLET